MRIAAIFSVVLVACTGAPRPPTCDNCQPYTPAPIPRPVASATPSAEPASTADAQPTSLADLPKSPYTMQQLLNVHRAVAPRAIDDESFLFLYDGPGTMQLHASAPSSGEPAKQLTSFPDRVSSLRVAPGGKAAVFLKDKGGDENDQIFRIDLPSGKSAPLTGDPKVKNTLPCFDNAGKRIAWTANARNGKDMDLFVAPFPGTEWKDGSKAQAPTMELPGSWVVTDFQGDRVLAIEARSNVDHDVWVIDLKANTKKLLTQHKGDERWEAARFSRDGKAVFALTDSGREFVGLVAIDVASGARTSLYAVDHDLSALSTPRWTGPAKKGQAEDLLAFAVNKDGVESLVVLQANAKREVYWTLEPKISGVIGSIDVSPTGRSLYVSLESSQQPTEVFQIELGAGQSTRVTFADHNDVDENKLVKHRLASYETFDKRKISYFAWYVDPKPGQKLPVVIEIHGGPEAQSQPWFSAVRQYLALSGYAVVAPNVRGSLGYGKSFSHLDDKEKREDSVRDVSELGKHLAAQPIFDGKKMALYGGSYGGYMVLAGMTLYPEQWAAGIDIVGIANFRTFLEQTKPYRRALREAEYGSLEKDGALLDKISPIHKVDKIKAPLMVIHGTNDPRVPIGEAKQIVAALEKRKLPVVFLSFDDEGHGLSKLKNRLVAYPLVAKFLDEHLRGVNPKKM